MATPNQPSRPPAVVPSASSSSSSSSSSTPHHAHSSAPSATASSSSATGVATATTTTATPATATTTPAGNRKRKAAPRDLPPKIPALAVPESALYRDLLSVETRLDATLARKRLEIQEALKSPPKVKRILRVYLSNLSANQSWMKDEVDPASASLIADLPSWTFRIEGRLFDASKTRPSSHKFSSFFKTVVVELDRDPSLHPDENVIQWVKSRDTTESDGFEIKRKGDANVNAKIVLYLDHQPEQFKLLPPLATLLQLHTASRVIVLQNLLQYIRTKRLFHPEERTLIQCDEALRNVFGVETMTFPTLPERISALLAPADPIILNYTIRVDVDYHMSENAYDIEVEMDDPGVLDSQRFIFDNSSKMRQIQIDRYDEQIATSIQKLQASKLKHDFMTTFRDSPVDFIHRWIESQSKDMRTLLGETSVTIDDIRRPPSDANKPSLQEAVFHYLSAKANEQSGSLTVDSRTRRPG